MARWTYGWKDPSGNIEFVVYALALGLAVRELDPSSFEEGGQLYEFLAWHLRRSLSLYHALKDLPEFASETADAIFEGLRKNENAAPLRSWDACRDAFAEEVLGL